MIAPQTAGCLGDGALLGQTALDVLKVALALTGFTLGGVDAPVGRAVIEPGSRDVHVHLDLMVIAQVLVDVGGCHLTGGNGANSGSRPGDAVASGEHVVHVADLSLIHILADVDVLQVGTRNMQNFPLLQALGQVRKPVLLKRGMSATVTELLQAAEYILAGGNSQVILCERGIRTFETDSRATLDIAAIPVLKRLSHLPVIVDPSHAAGRAELVAPLALAAAAAGADGLMVEVHDRPACALSDGAQALSCDQFDALARQVRQLLPHACR